ncbi:hypothetical protein EGR_07061 [Echinococcus granulosus]|uniref:Uncharacterized protein n=1 Tax=Echinococcus granulosus TaxID=6210 RepID=W6UBV8_ECHGR|nr:hypothetical protein EGR_07061 [Echinococcus granulosus]EUB58041.1 hypothetical protein EGR_07061 [Echinococcus granulosus]
MNELIAECMIGTSFLPFAKCHFSPLVLTAKRIVQHELTICLRDNVYQAHAICNRSLLTSKTLSMKNFKSSVFEKSHLSILNVSLYEGSSPILCHFLLNLSSATQSSFDYVKLRRCSLATNALAHPYPLLWFRLASLIGLNALLEYIRLWEENFLFQSSADPLQIRSAPATRTSSLGGYFFKIVIRKADGIVSSNENKAGILEFLLKKEGTNVKECELNFLRLSSLDKLDIRENYEFIKQAFKIASLINEYHSRLSPIVSFKSVLSDQTSECNRLALHPPSTNRHNVFHSITMKF